VARQVRLAVDGEVVAFTRDEGDKIEVRVRSERTCAIDPAIRLLERADGAARRPDHAGWGRSWNGSEEPGRGFIRHYNLRRTITVEANLDKT
jgi:hypothetical protein